MHIIGRGRYAREAYPTSPSAGGGAAIVPLSRQRFIDGGTTHAGPGASEAPFATIAAFMASRTNVSVADATANYVGWVMPALNGYVENVAFPAYVSTELRADSIGGSPSVSISGNVTWANVAGAFAAAAAVVSLHNISVLGSFTITDDAGAPSSSFFFSGDEAGPGSAILSGGLVANTTTALVAVEFDNAVVLGGINLGIAATSASMVAIGSQCSGAITAKSMSAIDTTFSSATIALNANNGASFFDCRFSQATALTCLAGATFDGSSWRNFSEAGGTRTAGTIVLVQGGYDGGDVPGAALTAAATNVSLNGTGADAGFTGENSGNHYSTSNGTPTSVTLKTGGGELNGDTLLITKQDLGANALAVKNNAGTTIGTIPANERGFVLAKFLTSAGDWTFVSGGSLAA